MVSITLAILYAGFGRSREAESVKDGLVVFALLERDREI